MTRWQVRGPAGAENRVAGTYPEGHTPTARTAADRMAADRMAADRMADSHTDPDHAAVVQLSDFPDH